jgi:hypothetical protein
MMAKREPGNLTTLVVHLSVAYEENCCLWQPLPFLETSNGSRSNLWSRRARRKPMSRFIIYFFALFDVKQWLLDAQFLNFSCSTFSVSALIHPSTKEAT